MKKVIIHLKKLFYITDISESEKITEKVFLRTMITSVLSIFLCAVCLFGMTWAWFSESVTSNSTGITSASFDVAVTVSSGADSSEIAPSGGNYILSQSNDRYTVTLKATGSASTGYCKVNINGVEYYTVPIKPGGESDTLTFEIDCSSAPATVIFTPSWSRISSDTSEEYLIARDAVVVATTEG